MNIDFLRLDSLPHTYVVASSYAQSFRIVSTKFEPIRIVTVLRVINLATEITLCGSHNVFTAGKCRDR